MVQSEAQKRAKAKYYAKLRAKGLGVWQYRSSWICTSTLTKELVSILLASPNWQTVTCVVRKRLEAWEKLQGK